MISVIVPVYNTSKFLRKCLDSIIAQTYSDLEIICINDGSTDNSLEILNEFASKDKRIIVFSQENSGVSSARNRGLEIATGDYISFVDSDDSLAPNMYSVLIELMQKYAADIAHCGYRRVKENNSFVDIKGTEEILVHSSNEALHYLLSGSLFVGGLWNKLISKKLFENVRFDSTLRFNEDVLVCFNTFSKARSIVFYDAPLYCYYEHKSSTCSVTNALIKAVDCCKAAKMMFDLSHGSLFYDAGIRYLYSLIGLYRAYLFESIKNTKAQRKLIKDEIKRLNNQNLTISRKQQFNYHFMKSLPQLYRLFYKIYDSIRTPNWDV